MSDLFLKSAVGGIKNAIGDNLDNITEQLQAGDAGALQKSVSALLPFVSSVAPLAGVLIGDLAGSLTTAAGNISGKAGGDDPQTIKAAAADRQNNLELLKKLYGTKVTLP